MEVRVILCILINAIFWQWSCCEENSIYGIILVKFPTHTERFIYNITSNSQNLPHNKINAYSATTLSIEHHDTEEILKGAMVAPMLKGVPIQQIFLQLFYSIYYYHSLTDDEMNKTRAIDQKLVLNYMSYLGLTQIQTYLPSYINLFTFGYYSINIENEKLDQNIIMIYTPTDLFIGFFVSNGYNLSPQIISKVKYNSQDYSIVAKRFLCACPLTVNYLIYKNLINKKDSEENNEIEHPCIPIKKLVVLKSINDDYSCVENPIIKEPYKFVGAFNIFKCWKLIEDAITDKEIALKFKSDIFNFADVNLPLLKNVDKTLKLNTLSSLNLHMLLSGNIEYELQLIEEIRCEKVEEEMEIEARDISCFEIVYMQFLLTNVLGFSGKNYIIGQHLPESDVDMLMFADPRVGYSPYSESSAVITTSETVDKSATTSPHLTMIFTDETVTTLPTSQQQISSTEDETVATSIAYEYVTTSVSDAHIFISSIDQPITTTTKPHGISTVLTIYLGTFGSCLLLSLVLIIVIYFKRRRPSRFEQNL